MTAALIYLTGSIIALSIIAGVFRIEDAQGGQLIILRRVRGFFDRVVLWIITCCSWIGTYIRHSFARLFFHYLAHRLLKRLYAVTRTLELKTEELLRQNKRTARRISTERHERSHLDEIADHKQKTSLSDAQIEKMRSLD